MILPASARTMPCVPPLALPLWPPSIVISPPTMEKALAGGHLERAAVDGDAAPGRGAQKSERLGRGDSEGAGSGVGGAEALAALEAELVGGRDVERALEVEGRVRAEHHASRVEEEEVRARDRRAQRAVDVGTIAAGHAADHVADRVRA